MQTAQTKSNAKLLKAIANEYRLEIINLLLAGEKNVGELNKTVKVSQPSLSQHLNKLRKVGVVNSRRDARNIYYFVANPISISRLIGDLMDMQQIAK